MNNEKEEFRQAKLFLLSARGAMFNLFVIVLCYVGERHFLFINFNTGVFP
jgi:hypothetical protein